MKKYKAICTISYEFEFEDDGDLCIEDRAFEDSLDGLSVPSSLLDHSVSDIVEVSE